MVVTLCKSCLRYSSLMLRVKPSTSVLFSRHYDPKYTRSPLYADSKSGRTQKPKRPPIKDLVKTSLKLLPGELKMLKNEWKHNFEFQPMNEEDMTHGNYEVIYRFDRPSLVNSWLVTADADNGEGYSSANFTFSRNRTGLFHGILSHKVPKTGTQKYAGYTNISAPKPKKSFQRSTHFDWSMFNCLTLRVRGDGRPYMIVIGVDFKIDVNWLNRWCFPLYTRGGPYWQDVKIPFSKFYVTHHGRVQDKQEYLPLEKVNSFAITCMDHADGPFHLEIDTIALMYDINASKKSYFELYANPYWEVQN